jgi:predicted regulator of Ras-like GTPase activity (Roadblock/LC7/MglB family)
VTDVQAVLDRVTRIAGVRGALIASAGDGLVVAEQLMEDVDGRAAAALAGSLVSRLVRTASAAGRRAPEFVQLRAERGSILAAPSPADLVLIAVAGPEANVGLARLEMLDAASGLG